MKPGRALLPASAFIATVMVAIAWAALFPDEPAEQSRWIAAPDGLSWWQTYMAAGNYWITLSQALSIAFAAVALRRWHERRSPNARRMALGGVTFSGLLAAGACFLVGCCGSPMLTVWASLLGASFLPAAKPLLALLTVGMLAGAWWSMERRDRRARSSEASCAPGCCDGVIASDR